MSIRLEMSNGTTFTVPTDATVEQWTEEMARGPAWRVLNFDNGTIAINRDQVAAVLPGDWWTASVKPRSRP